MSSSNATEFEQSQTASRHRNGGRCQGDWSPFNIGAMVLGFILFWPLGLFMLFWILSGRSVRAIPAAFRRQLSRLMSWFGFGESAAWGDSEDNEVFNAYQQTQYDRIKEIKDEIRDRSRRFKEFRADAKRRADEEEFRRFMSDTPVVD